MAVSTMHGSSVAGSRIYLPAPQSKIAANKSKRENDPSIYPLMR